MKEKFPLSEADLLALGIGEKEIENIFPSLKKEWADSGFSLRRSHLLRRAESEWKIIELLRPESGWVAAVETNYSYDLEFIEPYPVPTREEAIAIGLASDWTQNVHDGTRSTFRVGKITEPVLRLCRFFCIGSFHDICDNRDLAAGNKMLFIDGSLIPWTEEHRWIRPLHHHFDVDEWFDYVSQTYYEEWTGAEETLFSGVSDEERIFLRNQVRAEIKEWEKETAPFEYDKNFLVRHADIANDLEWRIKLVIDEWQAHFKYRFISNFWPMESQQTIDRIPIWLDQYGKMLGSIAVPPKTAINQSWTGNVERVDIFRDCPIISDECHSRKGEAS